MHLAVLSIALAFAILNPVALPVPASPAGAHVLLNELCAGPASDWDGSGAFSSRDDEWIEVVNLGPDTADLAGYLLTDGDRIPRYAFSSALETGARQVVFGRDSYDWERAHGFPAYGLSLANGGDSVMLWQVVGADTVLVDSYAYKSHEAASDRATGRRPDGGEWTLFDGLNPYTGTIAPPGTGCAPSPALPNTCGDVPVRNSTWSAVKSIYR
jgi:hypothetical protein